jgi:hypothetical protein
VLIVGDSVAQYTDSPIVCVTRHPSGLLQIWVRVELCVKTHSVWSTDWVGLRVLIGRVADGLEISMCFCVRLI